ncbi:MAG: phosphoribosylformylglycinamidine synthase [Candidatus Kapabacteria bacterium]|nr:phosphoribosylformylglycinamidine synthase [Ignavibacteriota bacterium]MCW5884260.1 phosphoribosylformylglycinamidine synthase [Candidatus Kapabacteria bacterium]
MYKFISLVSVLLFIFLQNLKSENTQTDYLAIDSIYIAEVEMSSEKLKIMHAEPLFIDLIRDLGARQGEKEWNIAFGLTDNKSYDEYEALIEYEFAPIDRLGLEIELPFTFHYPNENDVSSPGSRLNSLKLAAQYTFLVSDKAKTSLAIGYLHEFELTEFQNYKSERMYAGNIFNPFFIGAKRWGNNFHTLIYAGPQVFQHFSSGDTHTNWQINTNFHYMISGTRNFIGVEINKDILGKDFDMIIRPQMRLEINKQLMVGIVTGIPIDRENQRFSSFLRLIYEPPH